MRSTTHVDALQSAIAHYGERLFQRLAARRHPRALPPALELPPLIRETLSWALDLESPDAPHRDTLWRTWTEWMPGLLVEAMATDHPAAALFHTPLELAAMPRLAGACARLTALLREAGVEPARVLPPLDHAPTLADLYRQTHFGRCMPMLYTFPHDLNAYATELDHGTPPLAVVDERLCAPLVHELSHLHNDREPLWPPCMEESVAGWLGTLALPTLVWPEPGHDHALTGAHWFAQIGQALCYAFGTHRILRAHAGLDSWRDTLGELANALVALGEQQYQAQRAPHFLGETTRPMLWVSLISSCSPRPRPGPDDLHVVAAALRTTWNVTRQSPQTQVWRVEALVPEAPVVLDFAAGVLRAPARGDDPVPPTWWLPPALCTAWLAAGHAQLAVRFQAGVEIPRDEVCAALALALMEPGRASDLSVAGARVV